VRRGWIPIDSLTRGGGKGSALPPILIWTGPFAGFIRIWTPWHWPAVLQRLAYSVFLMNRRAWIVEVTNYQTSCFSSHFEKPTQRGGRSSSPWRVPLVQWEACFLGSYWQPQTRAKLSSGNWPSSICLYLHSLSSIIKLWAAIKKQINIGARPKRCYRRPAVRRGWIPIDSLTGGGGKGSALPPILIWTGPFAGFIRIWTPWHWPAVLQRPAYSVFLMNRWVRIVEVTNYQTSCFSSPFEKPTQRGEGLASSPWHFLQQIDIKTLHIGPKLYYHFIP
jgi:hypothetical protein